MEAAFDCPSEVLFEIFKLFDEVQDLCACSQTCHLWKTIVFQNEQELYRELFWKYCARKQGQRQPTTTSSRKGKEEDNPAEDSPTLTNTPSDRVNSSIIDLSQIFSIELVGVKSWKRIFKYYH